MSVWFPCRTFRQACSVNYIVIFFHLYGMSDRAGDQRGGGLRCTAMTLSMHRLTLNRPCRSLSRVARDLCLVGGGRAEFHHPDHDHLYRQVPWGPNAGISCIFLVRGVSPAVLGYFLGVTSFVRSLTSCHNLHSHLAGYSSTSPSELRPSSALALP